MHWRMSVLSFLFAALLVTSAQRVVMVHEEPRHRIVHTTPALRVLDVQIAPGDTTLFHTHDTPITYVTLGTSSTDQRALGGAWNGTVPRDPPPGRVGAVRGVVGYVGQPLTHRVTNVGRTLFRLIAVANRGPGDADAASAAPGEEVGQPNAWFRYSRVTLAPGDRYEFEPSVPTVVVLTSDARFGVERPDGWRSSVERPGGSLVLETGRSVSVFGDGTAPADLVFVEVR